MRARTLAATVVAALTLLAGSAHAALYTYNFIGTVRAMADTSGAVPHFNFEVGDQITFSFTLIDESSNPFVGFEINGQRGGFGRFQEVSYSNPAPDGDPSTPDLLSIVVAGPQAPSIVIRFLAEDNDAFPEHEGRFPPSIDPTRFDEATFAYHIRLDSVFADGTLDQIAPAVSAPEPSALAIFGSALLALILMMRRQRKPEPPFIAD